MSKIKLTPTQITKFLQRFTQKELADILEVSQRTIRRKIKPSDKPKQKRGCKKKITGETLTLLLSFTSYHSEYNTLTQQEMVILLYNKKGILVSQQTISRTLIYWNRTRKKITSHYQEQRISEIKRFEENIKHLPLIKFSAIDECHFYLNEAPRYAYAPKGQRAIAPAPGNKRQSYSLIIWVQNKKEQGIIHYELIEEKVNTKVFHDFLANAKNKEASHLLLDNVSFHRAFKKRKELGLPSIEEQLSQENVKLTYLPPYSPQINPAELLFNVIRHNIEKSCSWTLEKLKSSIDQEMERLNKEDLNKYFQKCLRDKLSELVGETTIHVSCFKIMEVNGNKWLTGINW